MLNLEADYEDKRLQGAQQCIDELIHHMYRTGSISSMENALDELTSFWELSIPKGYPKIKRKQSKLFDEYIEKTKNQGASDECEKK